jgi:hypothetical protein
MLQEWPSPVSSSRNVGIAKFPVAENAVLSGLGRSWGCAPFLSLISKQITLLCHWASERENVNIEGGGLCAFHGGVS